MSGSPNSVAQEAPDWENMTNQELHDKFAQLMTEQVHDIESRFAEAIDRVEKLIDTKLDAKFTELLARLPPQPAAAPAPPAAAAALAQHAAVAVQPPLRQRARRLIFADTQASRVGAASHTGRSDPGADSEDEVQKAAPPPARPGPCNRQRGHPPNPQVRDDEYVPKL